MPFDSQSPVLPRTSLARTPLLYLLPSQPDRDAGSAGLLAAEIAGLRSLGRPILPFLLGPQGYGADAELLAEARRVAAAAAESPLKRAFTRPLGLARAARLAMRQTSMPAGKAMALGARVAAAALRHGCTGIHATTSDAGATAALIGGRLAGLQVSLATGAGDAPDLPLQLGAADLVLAPSRETASALSDLAPLARIHVVPQGLDAQWFRPGSGMSRNGRLLCLAPLVPQSGLAALIGALARMPPAARPVIDVIGAGPLLETLRATALEAGVSDHLRFLGARGRDWVAAEGARYLGLVAPGLPGEAAGVPIAVLQAMALELPVLASALPGLREVLPAEAGHLVSPGDEMALARGLHWLMTMPEEQRRRFGTAGRARVLHGLTVGDRAASLARLLPRGEARAISDRMDSFDRNSCSRNNKL
jgi:glycosyltransferase involved in cell wall biosynthesis